MKRVVAVMFCVLIGACEGTNVTQNTSVPDKPQAAATPAAVAPVAVVPTPAPAAAWDVKCSTPGKMTVTYSGEASYARLFTYYTSFDGPAQYAPQWDTIAKGNSVTRTFPACTQGDAEPESGRPAGHCFYDKAGAPVSAEAATSSCKPVPTPTPRPTPTPCPSPSPTPTPTPQYCFYQPDCGNQFSARHSTSCPDSTKALICSQQGGTWSNWNGQSNQCRIPFPGVSLSNFQLVPGQSAANCKSKNS